MILVECDRCKRKNIRSSNITIHQGDYVGFYDLCFDCSKKLEQFIKGDKE